MEAKAGAKGNHLRHSPPLLRRKRRAGQGSGGFLPNEKPSEGLSVTVHGSRLDARLFPIPVPAVSDLHHFYHIYADGDWRQPVEEHLHALAASGLAAAKGFSFKVGLVGSDRNAAAVRDCLNVSPIPWTEVAHSRAGWEQVTLGALARESHTLDGFAFYAHTKGASSPTRFNTEWRRRMTHFTVWRWRDALQSLETHHAYGCHWMKLQEFWLFGGNFWWTRMAFLRLLPPVGTNSRWAAEGWIGLLQKYVDGFSACDPAGPFPGKV